jgi:hypothetical protein
MVLVAPHLRKLQICTLTALHVLVVVGVRPTIVEGGTADQTILVHMAMAAS